MRWLIIYCFVLCSITKVCTAQQYFNNRYDTFGSCDGASIIDTFNNSYLTAGFTCSAISFYAMNLRLYDVNGNTIKNRTYNWANNNFQNGNGFSKNGNKYLLSGSRFYKNDTSLVFQWLFNTNLDSIKYNEYGYLNQGNIVLSIIDYQQKNYFMVGQVYDSQYNSEILLIKTDTSGNEIWKKKIGLPGWDETAWCIKISSDNKLLISGNKQVHNNQSTNGAYILKADTNGAVIWEQYFPSNNGVAATSLVELPNTDIVAVAGQGYGSTTRMELIKLDSAGNLIFDRVYGLTTDHIATYSLLLNNHNNLVAVGQNYYPSVGGKVNGVMYEFNQNGDSLFSREYAIQPGSQNYFRDVVQAPDNGYVFSGFISPLFANGGTGNQDIWLLKTDSTFCENAISCGYPTSVSSNQHVISSQGISLFPNPVQNVLNLQFENSMDKKITIRLTDLLGKLIGEYPLQLNGNNETELDLSILPNGMYCYTIELNDMPPVTGKVTVLK